MDVEGASFVFDVKRLVVGVVACEIRQAVQARF